MLNPPLQGTSVVLQQRGMVSDLQVLTLISTPRTQLGPTSVHRSQFSGAGEPPRPAPRGSLIGRFHSALNAAVLFLNRHSLSHFHSKSRTHLSPRVISRAEDRWASAGEEEGKVGRSWSYQHGTGVVCYCLNEGQRYTTVEQTEVDCGPVQIPLLPPPLSSNPPSNMLMSRVSSFPLGPRWCLPETEGLKGERYCILNYPSCRGDRLWQVISDN